MTRHNKWTGASHLSTRLYAEAVKNVAELEHMLSSNLNQQQQMHNIDGLMVVRMFEHKFL